MRQGQVAAQEVSKVELTSNYALNIKLTHVAIMKVLSRSFFFMVTAATKEESYGPLATAACKR